MFINALAEYILIFISHFITQLTDNLQQNKKYSIFIFTNQTNSNINKNQNQYKL